MPGHGAGANVILTRRGYDAGWTLRGSYRYQLIYRPIFQFETAFVRWRAESSILFSFDTHVSGG
jgi:hypothetical protein